MKRWIRPCMAALLMSLAWQVGAQVWQPGGGRVQIPLWPHAAPGLQAMPGPEKVEQSKKLLAGKTVAAISNVSVPTMTLYLAKGKSNGAVLVVFPGGGFQILAIDLEGSEACDWANAQGMSCVLVKYRVPGIPYDWHCDCRPDGYEVSTPSLQDTQRAIALVRAHASEWKIDPHRVGVMGFSAGGYLVAETSTRYRTPAYRPVDAADRQSLRPDFALAIYPGHITRDTALNKNLPIDAHTPPTFIVQAEDDHVDGVEQAQVYFDAMKKAGAPAELHIYANGGHAFGLRPTALPITHWPELAQVWLHTIGVLPTP